MFRFADLNKGVAVAQFLNNWHVSVASEDTDELPSILL